MRTNLVDDEELEGALSKLFHERCAFCESRDLTHAYRFRPTEEAGPSSAAPIEFADRSHLYYCWLANAWENIYSICADCRPLEDSIFPVKGRRCQLPSLDEVVNFTLDPTGLWKKKIYEYPVLLDPCGNEDFRKHLAALPNGELIALGERGAVSIRHFKLNREGLKKRRRRAFRDYLGALLGAAQSHAPISGIFDFAAMEFGGSWFTVLYQMARRLGGDGESRLRLSQHNIEAYYAKQTKKQGAIKRISDVFESLSDLREQLQLVQKYKPSKKTRDDARPVAFEIRNFKAIEKLEIILDASEVALGEKRSDLSNLEIDPQSAPAIVILGENAAGKSTILEAMALALSDKVTRDRLDLDASRYMLNPNWMGVEGDAEPRKGRVLVRFENNDEQVVGIEPGFPLKQGGDEIRRIPVFAYGAFRMFLSSQTRYTSAFPIRSLFQPNYVLPNPEAWLVSIHGKPLFDEVARALKCILAIDQKVDLIEVNSSTQECALVFSGGDAGSAGIIRTPFSAVSSGFRAVLAMACDVMRGLVAEQNSASASLARARAVVLIDEVEAHLHPKWKMRIIQGLRQALPEVTFIVSTHDPLCLRGLVSGEVRVFHKTPRDHPGHSELPFVVEEIKDLPDAQSLTIEQLLTSDLFQLHTTDAPALESGFARAGDLLALEKAGELDDPDDAEVLAKVRGELRATIGRAIPIGSTEAERLIQQALEDLLLRSRSAPRDRVLQLRDDTRRRILNALENL